MMVRKDDMTNGFLRAVVLAVISAILGSSCGIAAFFIFIGRSDQKIEQNSKDIAELKTVVKDLSSVVYAGRDARIIMNTDISYMKSDIDEIKKTTNRIEEKIDRHIYGEQRVSYGNYLQLHDFFFYPFANNTATN